MSPERALVLLFPDWPVTAFLRTRARELGADPVDPDAPIAVIRANRVVACSAFARAQGVAVGQRRRDAQGACPRLLVVPDDPGRDERAFHAVLRVLEELAPGGQPLAPGLVALRARGPARFYGGEAEAARALAEALAARGYDEVRAGIADGVFTAEQAARSLPTARAAGPDASATGAEVPVPVRIVPPGASAAFLAPLPVTALGDEQLALLLARLGVRTLGDFAGLAPARVRERLGDRGLRLQALAAGADSRVVEPREPPPELARELSLEPPLELAEQIAFAVRQTVEGFCETVGQAGLVCTAVRITIEDDRDGRSERVWQHPVSFDAASVVDRVRWQLQQGGETAPQGAVTLVRIEAEAVDDGAAHQPALIGQGADERAHHAMTRLQAVLGHRGVLSPAIGGGRSAAEREVLLPWGDGAAPEQSRDRPWPGSPPSPLPAEVFRHPHPVTVRGPGGAPVGVDARGMVSGEPVELDGRRVVSWTGPWPVIERTWDAARARRAHRFQLVDDAGGAWLVVHEGARWWVEGRYA
ncbi:DNA polymerase Y family protein [Microbacterium sp. Marseille-Q6965]|uniref:DNA polymerase Y family protein n=1 Tax=Microbacterium sp. Marseille-Q6965 TaxID=2965072 RepID=UPI0021B82DE8|nr:DNA polymerase Y family protein [Microbacterium sp. Marseille-Q6965]